MVEFGRNPMFLHLQNAALDFVPNTMRSSCPEEYASQSPTICDPDFALPGSHIAPEPDCVVSERIRLYSFLWSISPQTLRQVARIR